MTWQELVDELQLYTEDELMQPVTMIRNWQPIKFTHVEPQVVGEKEPNPEATEDYYGMLGYLTGMSRVQSEKAVRSLITKSDGSQEILHDGKLVCLAENYRLFKGQWYPETKFSEDDPLLKDLPLLKEQALVVMFS